MGVHSPRAAYEAAVAYVADGDELMATRMYAENRLSYARYLEALRRGRALREMRPAEGES